MLLNYKKDRKIKKRKKKKQKKKSNERKENELFYEVQVS
jgi:hypothetical protein